MVKVLTPEEMKARKALLQEPETPLELDYQSTDVGKREKPFSDLRKLSNEQLLDRLDQIDKQAILIKWRIWWEIRSRFKSDKLFGQYINELRNDSTHGNLVGSQQSINQFANAGKFCERHRITDLNQVGMQISSIYELSRPSNEEISRLVYREVKNKGYSYTEVKRRIEVAKAINQVPETINYNESKPESISEEKDRNVIEIEQSHVKKLEDLTPEMAEVSYRREEVMMLQENLAENEQISEEQIEHEILLFLTRYQFSPLKLIEILKKVISKLQS